MTNRLLVTAVVVGTAALSLPVNAQVSGGSFTTRSAEGRPQRIAAAKAAFPSALYQALSPGNTRTVLSAAKAAPLPPATGDLVNFDNVAAPCEFVETAPLLGLEQYAFFVAPGTNGGAILNGCSEFGVDPHSGANFLAFNNSVVYDDGGIPETPELFFLGQPETSVSLWVSGGNEPGYPIGVIAFGSGAVQDVVTTTTASTWQQVTVSGTGITCVQIVGNPYWLVVDDISAE